MRHSTFRSPGRASMPIGAGKAANKLFPRRTNKDDLQLVASSKGRPGRNNPCPCKSGKKYKHCHGAPQGQYSPPVRRQPEPERIEQDESTGPTTDTTQTISDTSKTEGR